MANAKDRISVLPSLAPGDTLSGGAYVPISQIDPASLTLTTYKVLVNNFPGVALSGITTPGFVAYTGGGYVTRTFTGGDYITVNGGDGSSAPSWNHNGSGVTPGTYGTVALLPRITVDAFGHITSVSTVNISAGGTLDDITITGTTNQIAVASTFNPSITSGSYTISLPTILDFTAKTLSGGTYTGPTISAATIVGINVLTGTISGGTLSGVTITGSTINGSTIGATLSSTVSATTAQVLTLAFRDGSTMTTAAGIGTGSVVYVGTQSGLTGGPVTTSGTIGMAVAGVTAAVYGSATAIPVLTIDAFGRTTSATTAAFSASTDVLQVQVFT